MGFGTFDVLHPGHLFYLQQLKELGDFLVVVVARDKNVEKIKGALPKQNENERLEAVKKAGVADEAILGSETNIYQVLGEQLPDVIGLGYDQKANEEAIRTYLGDVEIVRLRPFRPEQYKSSLLKG